RTLVSGASRLRRMGLSRAVALDPPGVDKSVERTPPGYLSGVKTFVAFQMEEKRVTSSAEPDGNPARRLKACPTTKSACATKLGLILFFLVLSPIHAEDPAGRVVFTKSFPGSVPAWFSITVERSGDAVYREDPKDELPIKFHLAESDTAQIFDLAAK